MTRDIDIEYVGRDSEFDPKQISYPTDVVTVGQLRQMNPNWADRSEETRELHDFTSLCHIEQVLAENEFATKLSRPLPYDRYLPNELSDMLDEGWQEYGLSKGRQESREMERRIKSLASEMAAEVKGRHP